MIRTKGEAGTGDVVEAVRHMRTVQKQIRQVQNMSNDELTAFGKEIGASVELLQEVKLQGRMPVVNFAAGGVATPSDAALMMHLGADGVFVGSGVFKSGDGSASPKEAGARGKAIVMAVTHYDNPDAVAEASRGLGEAMVGISARSMKPEELLATRGW